MPNLFLRCLAVAILSLCVLLPALVRAQSIDANRATADELQTLRGIGPAMAARIIAERDRLPFRSLEDLARRVRGVGPRRLQQWQASGLVLSGTGQGGAGHVPDAASVSRKPRQGRRHRAAEPEATSRLASHRASADVARGVDCAGTHNKSSRRRQGARPPRSKAPSLFEQRPLFDCRSLFDRRARLE